MGAHVPYDPSKEQFLNNFYTRFPSGVGVYPEGLARSISSEYWNTLYIQIFLGFSMSEEDLQDLCSKYSDKYLSMTPKQFFEELDTTVTEVGLTLDDIKQKIKVFKMAIEHLFESDKTRVIAEQASKELNDYLTPVYVALRAKGYNRKELWG